MSDWIPIDERSSMECKGGSYWLDKKTKRLLSHAAEADRRIAERDELIRELAEWCSPIVSSMDDPPPCIEADTGACEREQKCVSDCGFSEALEVYANGCALLNRVAAYQKEQA